ncbi:sugar phosphate isomerase/epimerase family protein [Paenibacillus piri]|uniref:Sugar phosphate isomerase/epimerase n=1 Tax=Paenibacillus piri TaxID=2547395 RepID=A0A4R5KCN1_9BACL|nr:sugar phosphate isomerase/epimerase family protein [Paenibacillus piri]TDF92926.1 sugar phosphate isomerase/epimerase [Paenibacillus piri]
MGKYAVISGFLGGVKNRFMTYQNDRSLEQKIELASHIKGIAGLELCYPDDFDDFERTVQWLDQYGLQVSAINFRSRRSGRWMRGSFTSESAEERQEVLESLKEAMDVAEKLGCNRVTTCPLNEGHDYIFEMEYGRAYDYFEQIIREAALYNPRVRLCIEYKNNDPRARCFLGNAGETLAFCQQVGLPNVGVTLDFGHSIQAGERPAQAAVMLARSQRLFYVHLNDNDKVWDWDMLPGAYNLWDTLEFIYYLKKIGYDDWYSYDIIPKETSTVESFETAFAITDKCFTLAERISPEVMETLLKERNPNRSFSYLFSIL